MPIAKSSPILKLLARGGRCLPSALGQAQGTKLGLHLSVSIDVTDAISAPGECRSPTSPYASVNRVESVDEPDVFKKAAG